MIERSTETLPPDVEPDGEGDEGSVHVTVALVDRAGVYRTATTILDQDATAAEIADELIAALRATAAMHGGDLPVELARRLAS